MSFARENTEGRRHKYCDMGKTTIFQLTKLLPEVIVKMCIH